MHACIYVNVYIYCYIHFIFASSASLSLSADIIYVLDFFFHWYILVHPHFFWRMPCKNHGFRGSHRRPGTDNSQRDPKRSFFVVSVSWPQSMTKIDQDGVGHDLCDNQHSRPHDVFHTMGLKHEFCWTTKWMRFSNQVNQDWDSINKH